MAGLNDKRMLGTESGRIRRAARQVERAGGNPSALLNRAAEVKLGEGSAIQSSEDNVAFEEKKRLMQSGLLESKRRALLNPTGTPRTGQTPVEIAENIPVGPMGGASLNTPRPAGTAPQPVGTAPVQRSTAEVRSTDPKIQGLTAPSPLSPKPYDRGTATTTAIPKSEATMLLSSRTAPQSTGTAPQPSLTGSPPSLLRAPMDSAAAADSRSLSRRKEMRAAEDAITSRTTSVSPGNLADLKARDTQDRESAITAARTESAGNPSVTRQGVIDRINKERTAKGLQPFGEDIYKDIAKIDGEEAAGKQTALQKSLMEARTRFAQVPENTSSGSQGGLPVPAPLDTSSLQVPPPLFGGPPPESTKPVATTVAPTPSSGGLNARFSPGLLSKPPQELTDLRERSRQEPLERAKKERDKRYASMPDLFPSLGSDSTLNKLYKSALTRYTR